MNSSSTHRKISDTVLCNFTHPGHDGCKFYRSLYYSGGAGYYIKYIIIGGPRVTGSRCKALLTGGYVSVSSEVRTGIESANQL